MLWSGLPDGLFPFSCKENPVQGWNMCKWSVKKSYCLSYWWLCLQKRLHLEYTTAIWYIYGGLVCLDHEKSGNPGYNHNFRRFLFVLPQKYFLPLWTNTLAYYDKCFVVVNAAMVGLAPGFFNFIPRNKI
jgi:hypothetical protein